MKILVIGDTHGQLNKIREIFPKLTNLDLIAHTGDHLEDGHALEREFGIPVVAVKGNCDGSYSADDFEIIETDYGMQDGRLVIETRGALVQYVLQRYQIDTTKVHAKATAQQIVVVNLDELQGWLYH